MTIIAYKGEEIRGRDGKVVATLAEDIHSGDLNIRPSQFIMDGGDASGFLPEEVHQFVRDKLGSPSPEPVAEMHKHPAPPKHEKPVAPAKTEAKTKARPAKRH